MREIKMKPILFNTEMVQAILENRKTVTRRVAKPQPTHHYDEDCSSVNWIDTGGNNWACKNCGGEIAPFTGKSRIRAPYQVGDILYVRETWYCERYYESGVYGMNVCYKADNKIIPCIFKDCDEALKFEKYKYKTGWQPSLFMPKEAARIFLKVTDVKVERLQDITEMQVIKEGFQNHFHKESNTFYPNGYYFVKTWNGTIKKQDFDTYGWEANPWVWVIEFEREEF